MSLKKTEQILYSINKKTHSRQLQQMRHAIDSTPPRSLKKIPKPYQLIPYNRRYQIKVDNQQMISKILSVAQQDTSQKGSTVSRPLRGPGLEKWQIAQDNRKLYERLRRARPAIGSIQFWNREYSRSSCARGKHTIENKISHSSSKIVLSTDMLQQHQIRGYCEPQISVDVKKRAISKSLFKIKLPSFHQVKTEGNIQDQYFNGKMN